MESYVYLWLRKRKLPTDNHDFSFKLLLEISKNWKQRGTLDDIRH